MERGAIVNARLSWKLAFGAYRAASRNLMAPGAVETSILMVKLMRELSGAWDIPRPAGLYHFQSVPVFRRGQERMHGRAMVCYRWHGPYTAGARFFSQS